MQRHARRFLSAAHFTSHRLRRGAHFAYSNIKLALCLALIISMLSTSTPAAPQVLAGAVAEWRVSLMFWLEANDGASRVRQILTGDDPEGEPQETQEDRDARVTRVQIFPGDVTVRVGESVAFAAIAYDAQELPVGGVRFTWSGHDVGRDRAVRVTERGDFKAKEAGTFTVTAEGAGKQTQVEVTVLEGEQSWQNAQPSINGEQLQQNNQPSLSGEQLQQNSEPPRVRQVSTRDLPPVASLPRNVDHQRNVKGVKLAHAPKTGKTTIKNISTPAAPTPTLIACDNCGWDSGNYSSADDPGNQVGSTPGGAQDDGAGSGNFQIAAPILNLPGRGLDLSFNLAYNSRLWNKAGSELIYDIDRGWPAPGWSLGFGKILGMGVDNGSMIVEADGTRHSYTGTVTYASDLSFTDFVGHTTDSTFIDYSHHTGLGGAITSAVARFPNGTVIEYFTPGTGAMYPSRITDAQGNYITITYVNNTGPNIETVTDTLGRVINFYYDANGLLTAITAPPLSGTTPRTLVRLHYKQKTLSYGFAAGITSKVRNASPWVVDAIYYPGTNTGYWFGDTDSYSSYGMIAKVREQRGMTLTASSLTVQGTVTKGTESRESAYSYDMTPDYTLTDAPSYTSKTETWDGMDTTAAVTNYLVQQNASPRKVTITLPNGTKSIQYSYNAPGQFNDGLVYQDEIYGPGNSLWAQQSTVTWEQGAYDTVRPARTELTDRVEQTTTLQTTAAEFDYGLVYNQVTEVRNYDYGGVAKLRVTRTQYENSSSYTNRHIFNLVKQVEIFAANGTTRESRTEYAYDGATLKDTPNVVQHEESSNPYAPQYWVEEECEPCDPTYKPSCQQPLCIPAHWETAYSPATDYRGNVTQIKTYTDAATLTGPITETRTYDITGNMVTASTSCCELTSYDYTSATQYGYSTLQTRGSATDTTAQVKTSATYSFGTGVALTSKDANGRITRTDYFADTLRPQKVTLPTGAYTLLDYDDIAMTATGSTYLAGGTVIANQNVKHLNGLGQVRREEALTRENGVDYWDVVETKYDKIGQVWKKTLPYRDGQTPQWGENFYDGLGRIIKVKAPNGSETKNFYNEATRPITASNTAGQTLRMVDAWGRERWGRTDAQGRLVEVVEPDPAGNGLVIDAPSGTPTASTASLVTKYSYDTLGNLTLVVQGSQQRKFDYDSLGRVTHQKMSEASATLDANGLYAGVGSGGIWSDVFAYDTRGNLISRTDARGVKTVFTYNNDPLNRLQSISYNTSGVGSNEQTVAPAATLTYSYIATGDVTRVDTITAQSVSTQNYDYDVEGRISTVTLTLAGRAAYPMATSYIYDTLGRVTDFRYPAQYGVVNNPRKLAHQDYDVASRLSMLKYDSATYASEIIYNAASQATELKVGAAGPNQITENYTFDVKTGLLTNQQVIRGTNTTAPLLNLTYDYLRDGTTTGKTGQLTKITDGVDAKRNRNYEYDALGRLKTAKGGITPIDSDGLWTQTYTYDRYGNRTTVVATGTAADESAMPRDGLTGLTYGAATNRITGYTYDGAGNLTRGKRSDGLWQRYEYDAAGRLVTIKDDTGAPLASYQYGASNERLIAYDGDVNSNKIYYAWSGSAVVAEYSEDSSATGLKWAKSYVYMGGRLLATVKLVGSSQQVQYHHPDRLGTRLLTNNIDTSVQEQLTLPFGTALDAESTGSTSRRFTSYERTDATKLDYAVNRYYDSGQGRFTQVDPIGMSAVSLSDPQSLNMYAYCSNDPVNRIDPSGLFWGWLTHLIKSIFGSYSIRRAVIRAVITFTTTGNLHQAIREGITVFGQEVVGRGWMTSVSRGTPPFNPNAGTGLGTGVSGLSRYIIYNFSAVQQPEQALFDLKDLAALIKAARAIIEHASGDCAKLLGKDALAKFDKVAKDIEFKTDVLVNVEHPFRGVVKDSWENVGFVNAITVGQKIYLNPNGQAFNTLTRGGQPYLPPSIRDAASKFGVNQQQYATALVVHEFLHTTGRFKPDSVAGLDGKIDTKKSQDYQNEVLKKCFSKK